MVLDHRRAAGSIRVPRRTNKADDEPLNERDAALAMQATAGNRATRAALAEVTAQRAAKGQPTARSSEGAGGVLTLGTNQPFSILSATWSQTLGVHADDTGAQRGGQIQPIGIRTEQIVVTLAGEKEASARMYALLEAAVEGGTTFESGTLRLNRRSSDGALPASEIALSDVAIVSVERSRDDPPVVTVRLGVAALSAAGLGKEAPDAAAVGKAEVNGGAGGWTPLPILQWEREQRQDVVSQPLGTGSGGITSKQVGQPEGAVKFKTRVAAGPNLARLSDAMSKPKRLTIVYTPKGGGPVLELHEVLVSRMAGSLAGPAEVEVDLIAERVMSK